MNAMHKIPSKFVPKKFAMTSKVRFPRFLHLLNYEFATVPIVLLFIV